MEWNKEAIERQLKGLSVEGLEFKMIPFENSELAILFILSRIPSLILIERMNQFTSEVQKEFGELFLKMDHLDFTENEEVKEKIYDFMVQKLKFEKKSLT